MGEEGEGEETCSEEHKTMEKRREKEKTMAGEALCKAVDGCCIHCGEMKCRMVGYEMVR